MRGEAVDMFTLVLFTVHTNNVVSYRGIVRCASIAAVRHGGDWRKLTVPSRAQEQHHMCAQVFSARLHTFVVLEKATYSYSYSC